MRSVAWLPDSRGLLITKMGVTDAELLMVPTNGELARRLDIDPDLWI